MEKDDTTWLNICYVAFAIVVAYVGFQAVYSVGLQFGWVERYDEWFPTLNNVLAIVAGAVGVLWLRASGERREYHLSAVGEVRKVAWPTIPDTKKMTVIVAVVVTIFSIILFLFDMVWSEMLQKILP